VTDARRDAVSERIRLLRGRSLVELVFEVVELLAGDEC